MNNKMALEYQAYKVFFHFTVTNRKKLDSSTCHFEKTDNDLGNLMLLNHNKSIYSLALL